MPASYRLFVVLDRDYGPRLTELAQSGPVWIVDTPANRNAARRIWNAAVPGTFESVTTFTFGEGSSFEDVLINELPTIAEHHGLYSGNPPYTMMEVIGTEISEKIKDALARFGFDQFEPTPLGFRAIRSFAD
jgi:hypothetical protein